MATLTTARTWSAQQEAIFHWFRTSEVAGRKVQHLVARARAGCGKTTTVIEGINHAPEQKILMGAFGKKNQIDLQARLHNPRAKAQTFHSLGFTIARAYWDRLFVGEGSQRAESLTQEVCGVKVPDAVKKLVTKLHSKGREITPTATTIEPLVDLALSFDLEPEEIWQDRGFSVERIAGYALAAMNLAASVKPTKTGIDYADMIFLPVRNEWLNPTYDLVVVDEAQDLTVAQLAIAQGVCKGRMCLVGDDRQAMYGFRGADVGSLDRLTKELGAAELGLTVTYRCGVEIVDLAARLVPDFQAGPQNPVGTIRRIPEGKLLDQVQPGDFVLSRTNAPLVDVAMTLLRAGRRARVAGKDVGKGLQALAKKLATGNAAHSVPAFLEKVTAWVDRSVARLVAAGKDDKVDALLDQAAILTSIADGARGMSEVFDRLEALFTDDGLGDAGVVTCSSIHRAKGLEANRVFVLEGTLRDQPGVVDEEQNIRYVAITRAKEELVWVA